MFGGLWREPCARLTMQRVASRCDASAVWQESALCDVTDAQMRTARLPVTLRHQCADPLAVAMHLRAQHGSLPWVFAADVLRDGISRLSGRGAVRVWPALPMSDRPEVVVRVAADSRVAVVRLPAGMVHAFLDGVARCRGVNALHDALDAELTLIVGGAH